MAIANTYSYIVSTIIHKDAFRPEENGRTGSRPLGLSGLSRLANRGRDYDAFLLTVALLTMPETQDFPRRCHYPDEYLQRVPKAPSAESARSKVGE